MNSRSSGDLASLGNRPDLRLLRTERFTTDNFGFRINAADNLKGPYEAVLFGDSFSVGASLNDNETLTSQLEALTQHKIFNAGGIKNDLGRMLLTLEHLNMPHGVIFFNYLERNDIPQPADFEDRPKKPRPFWVRVQKILEKRWDGFWAVCPIEILAQHLYKTLQNDRILPNSYDNLVVVKSLKNGRPMLFLPEDVRNFTRPRSYDISGFIKLNAELTKHGYRLCLLLIPDKYSVYAHLLQHPPEPPHVIYLDQLEMKIQKAGIPVINLLPTFYKEAGMRLPEGKYIYFPDDTHWNRDGVNIAAEKINEKGMF